MVDLVERLDVLLEQEVHVYRADDYLSPVVQTKLRLDKDIQVEDSISVSSSLSSSTCSGINEIWREKICEWSYQVIDHFDLSREIVSIAMNYLDRYLSKKQVNKKGFQLLAMSCLHLAVKLFERENISMKSMIELSRGYFLCEQMEEMEMAILSALSWKVHPPTAYCFSKHILFLLPYSAVPMEVRCNILELSRFLVELSVLDYFFVTRRASVVALSSLFNAMDLIDDVDECVSEELYKEMQRVPAFGLLRKDVEECRTRLRILYAEGGYDHCSTSTCSLPRVETVSPVCVSYGVRPHGMNYAPIDPCKDNPTTPCINS